MPIPRGGAAPSFARSAELGAGQSRKAAHRLSGGRRAVQGGGHAAADVARHAHPLLRRRDRMRQARVPPDRLRDSCELNVPGLGLGRDGCRTPMQWDASDKADFTTGEPWLPLSEDHRQINVENQRADRTSIFALNRRLIAQRRAHPALAIGDYRPMAATGDLAALPTRAGPRAPCGGAQSRRRVGRSGFRQGRSARPPGSFDSR